MLFYKTFQAQDASQRECDWVVFVHGAGGSSAVWFKQIRDFQKEFNVLLVDLRGHGRSNSYHGDGSRYSINAISQDILDVLDKERIPAAHFVGVSLGTILIRALIEMAPERVQSVIYAGAVVGFTVWARILIVSGQALKYMVPFNTLYSTFAWFIMPGRKAQEARKVFIRESKRVAPEEFRRWLMLIPEVNRRLRKWASETSACRSLYLMGGKDYMFLPPARALVAKTPDSFLDVIQGVGHVCNIERPERFNELAIQFLKGEVPTSAASR
jgi:pimeloyl-ACP methyl ester carboxylesterase